MNIDPQQPIKPPLSLRAADTRTLIANGRYREAVTYLRDNRSTISESKEPDLVDAGELWHDSNNLLTALLAYCDLSVVELKSEEKPLNRQQIINYIESAKELARRLEVLREIDRNLYHDLPFLARN